VPLIAFMVVSISASRVVNTFVIELHLGGFKEEGGKYLGWRNGNNICNVTHYLRLAARLMDMQQDENDDNTFHYKMLTLKWNTNICPDILENMEAGAAKPEGLRKEKGSPAGFWAPAYGFWVQEVPGWILMPHLLNVEGVAL